MPTRSSLHVASERLRPVEAVRGAAGGAFGAVAEAAGDVPEIMTDPPPRVMFKGFGDSSLNFSLLAWVPTVDVGLQAQNALRIAILRKLGASGIHIPFPQRDLHIRDEAVGERPVTG